MTKPPATRNAVIAFATALGGYAFFGSSISFLGWPLNIPRLTDWLNDEVSIQPNACMLLMLSGAAVVLVQWRAWRAVSGLGVLVGLGGALILLQYIVGADFGFNHQLLFGRTWGQITTLTPGRVGPPASISFTFTGLALVLLARAGLQPRSAHLRRLVPMLGASVCLIMAFSLLGYLFGAEQFYTIPWLTAIAFQTATMLCAVGIGMVVSVPEHHPMLLLCEDSGAGALARTAIPALVVAIPLVLWLRIRGYEQGYYDLGTGRALGALALVMGTLVILWIALIALRRHEQALREADRRKDEFLAMLAHELRNPLAPIRTGLEILAMERGTQGETVAVMQQQVGHLVRLVDDLLDVSRIVRGRVELRRESIELAMIMRRSVDAISPAIASRHQRLVITPPPRPLCVDADPVRLVQVLENLLNNASKYTDDGGRIEITGEEREGKAVINVRDNGVGIEPELLPDVFDLFTQSARSLERSQGGLGIGLTLVRSLVEMHGGEVSAHSEGPGQGSRFEVSLPISTRPQEVAPDKSPDTASASRRVLVVDDNVAAARMLALLIKCLGPHQIEIAHDGPATLEKAKVFRPEIILLDIGLPRMDGLTVAWTLRQNPDFHSTLLVALTGYGREEDRRKSREAGFDEHFVKPVELETLRQLFSHPKLVRSPLNPCMAPAD